LRDSCTRDACKTHPQQLVNLSRTTPSDIATSTRFLLTSSPRRFLFSRASEVAEKSERGGERERRALSRREGCMRDSASAEGIHVPSTLRPVKTFNVPIRGISLMQLLSRKGAASREQDHEKEKKKKERAKTRPSYVADISKVLRDTERCKVS